MGSRKDGWPNPVFGSPRKKIHSLIFAIILSLLPASAPLAAVVSSSWIADNGNWSVEENWNPAEVPNNSTDTFRVSISGVSSIVTLDQDAAVEDLSLSGDAQLLINGKNLEFEDDGGGVQSSTITNNGLIHLKGVGYDSRLVIYGEVEYLGNGIILFDDNILHRIEGGGATTHKLFINTATTMLLKGASGGGKGTLGGGLLLENLGNLKLTKFTEFHLYAPALYPPPPTPWTNRGVIDIQYDSKVYFTGDLDQRAISGSATTGQLLVSGTLDLQNAHITGGTIQGTRQINAAGLTLDDVHAYNGLTCTGSLTIAGSNIIKSIVFEPGAIMSFSGHASLFSGADWDFDSDGSEFIIRQESGPDSLTLTGTHSFKGGKVKLGDPNLSPICLTSIHHQGLIFAPDDITGLQ